MSLILLMHHATFEKNLPCVVVKKIFNCKRTTHDEGQRRKKNTNCNGSPNSGDLQSKVRFGCYYVNLIAGR